jgi:hypothetical protein
MQRRWCAAMDSRLRGNDEFFAAIDKNEYD